jgi:hypothetical protein
MASRHAVQLPFVGWRRASYAGGMANEKPQRAATSNESDKFIVRLPDGMRDAIADAARKNNRTMNAEVVARLQASFEAARETALTGEQVERLSRRMEAIMSDVDAITRRVERTAKAYQPPLIEEPFELQPPAKKPSVKKRPR